MPNLGRNMQFITLHPVSIEIDVYTLHKKFIILAKFYHSASCSSFGVGMQIT
jgi:hypothetical protein